MAIVKATNSTRLLRDAIVLDMSDLGRQAERLMTAAREEAARVLREARREADELIAGAEAQGFTQGLQQGAAEGEAKGFDVGRALAVEQFTERLGRLSQRWEEAIASWNAERQRMLSEAREDVIRLALELGKKVVHRLAVGDPSVIQDQLRETLSLLTRPSSLRVSIHPSDRELTEQVLPRMVRALGETVHATLVDDPEIDPGGCRVATASGHIDATIRTQLERIAEALVPNAPHAVTLEAENLIPSPPETRIANEEASSA